MNKSFDYKEKKQKAKKLQYMIWWKPDGIHRFEYGPIYSKKTAIRDGNFYQTLYGAGNGGWEIYDSNNRMSKRRRY